MILQQFKAQFGDCKFREKSGCTGSYDLIDEPTFYIYDPLSEENSPVRIVKKHEVYGNQEVKLRPNLSTLMVNTNVDVIDFDSSKFFVGVGMGVARHKTKYYVTGTSPGGKKIDREISTKISHEFSYALNAGMSLFIIDGLNAELSYSWRDFGTTKPRKNEDNEDMTKKVPYRVHNLSLGFRIDI